MAVAVFLTAEAGATEVAIDSAAAKEVAIVSRLFPNAVPVKIVGRGVVGVKVVKVVNIKQIVAGETL